MGRRVLGVEVDGLAVFGDGLVQLVLGRAGAMPRLLWAGANLGSSSMALRYSAMASSSWFLACRALPRLLWASA